MASLDSNDREIYIYKNQKLYGKMQNRKLSLYIGNDEYIKDDKTLRSELMDILPEGIDLSIMMNLFNKEEAIELLPFLKNTIGDFDFSYSNIKTHFDKPIKSNLALKNQFLNILSCEMDIVPSHLYPRIDTPNGIQQLSISGYQHKLQVSIVDDEIKENYGDFILKPDNKRFWDLAINEHLNVSFMREFGFEVPFNAIIFDKERKVYHYLIKRFDIDENGNKLPQISLNALMRGDDKTKSSGTIEEISSFLCNRLDDTQKMLFLEYIYANALLYNNDLHKKNISFVFKNNQLVLSPVYDVINVYAIIPSVLYDMLSNAQCCLSIDGRIDGIKKEYFKQSAENLGLDFNQVQEKLAKIQDTYFEKYPQYIAEITKIPYIKNTREIKELFLQSYNKNTKTAQSESRNDNRLEKSSDSFEYSNPSGMNNSEYLRLFVWRDLEKQHNIKSENLDNEKKLIIENKISSLYLKLNCSDKAEFMEKLDEFVNSLVQELNINLPKEQSKKDFAGFEFSNTSGMDKIRDEVLVKEQSSINTQKPTKNDGDKPDIDEDKPSGPSGPRM